jgi:hypothetical protein
MIFAYNCHCQTRSTDLIKDSFKENLLKDKWVTDHILGLDPKTEIYKLTKYNPKGKFAGNITQFIDSLNFRSEYVAWCGNDYFTNVSGKYKFLDKDKISIAAETVSYSGEWTKPTEHREIKYLTFVISIDGETILLTKEE